MQNDILSILNESEGLNAKVFSLVRLKLLASLAALGPDGATYRELKAALDINDGVTVCQSQCLKRHGLSHFRENNFGRKRARTLFHHDRRTG